ncbi:TIGR03089 family protein [Rhodococcus antarcticus]|jgi:uncharacterized protein (TIGR03089 family)|uniref:TIGR03089 family protein n=1 Tax=Rhodococcus antarcticus TaxID=2987751 RepID=A0ABY6P1L5_9NOCA|nr:TIGR03089 family protein [Rhodococcus antarcticus]UZJ25535.1 TIGR03089 family protein [Rhodococcus antarcticus]
MYPAAAPTLADALLRPILAVDAARPLVTYYDDATGERVEVSGTTLANWAAKTANLLRDELGVNPGDPVAVLLPAHWQSVAVHLGVWWCGGVVVADPDGAEVALCTLERLPEAEAAPEVAVLSLDAFGRGIDGLAIGITDYATAVRVHGDAFAPTPVGGDDPALEERSVDEVLGAARASASRQGLTAQDRVLSSAGWDTTVGLVDGLLAVLAAGASLVQVANPDDARTTRRVQTEKVTREI